MTDAERAKQAKQDAKWRERAEREYQKQAKKIDFEAYNAGVKAGNDISLDKQINHAPRARLN